MAARGIGNRRLTRRVGIAHREPMVGNAHPTHGPSRFMVGNAHPTCALPILMTVLLLAAALAEGGETFRQSFAGEKTGAPMLALSSPDAAKYGKPTAEGFLFSLPKSETALAGAGLISQFHVRGDFEITLDYELAHVEPPAAGYGSGATLFVVTASGDGAAVSRCDRPKEGSTYTSDRASHLGSGHDKHDAKSAPAHAKSGKLRLVRQGTTLRYLTADGDGPLEELRREEFVDGDLTTVFLVADPGMATGALAVRFKEFSVTADELPLGAISESRARHWIVIWFVGSFAAVGIVIAGAAVKRKSAAVAVE